MHSGALLYYSRIHPLFLCVTPFFIHFGACIFIAIHSTPGRTSPKKIFYGTCTGIPESRMPAERWPYWYSVLAYRYTTFPGCLPAAAAGDATTATATPTGTHVYTAIVAWLTRDPPRGYARTCAVRRGWVVPCSQSCCLCAEVGDAKQTGRARWFNPGGAPRQPGDRRGARSAQPGTPPSLERARHTHPQTQPATHSGSSA